MLVRTRSAVVAYDLDGTRRFRAENWRAPRGPHDGPVIDDGTLYVTRADDDSLAALAAGTGSTLWTVELSGNPRAPVGTGDTVYAQDITGDLRTRAG